VIPIGSPNRLKDEAPDCEPNALPVVITIRPDYKVRELLTSVRRILIEDYVRQDQPCETLIDKLGLQGVVNRCPLFDIGVALTGFTQAMPELKNDLTISFTLSGGKLSGTFDYNASLFARESIARVSRHLLSILEQMLSNTDALIAELDLLTGEEREKVLAASRVTSESKAPERLVPDVILEWYDRTPDAVALVWKASSLTYGELARGVYKQARYLQEHGVSADILVGIQFDRSIETMVNVLGVLAAGGAYVPIDPEYPAGVLEKMLNIA